jgi:V/A-type H+-transporting ATPase subunit E
MTIENIIKKIESETVAEINNILNDARAKASEIQKEANMMLSEELNQIQNEGKKKITIMRNIHLSEARRMARRTILSAKEELIDECFDQAKGRLTSLSGEEYRSVIVQLIDSSLPLIGNKGKVRLTREEDKAILSSYPNLSVSTGLAAGYGGLIFESEDGSVVVDNTFNAILERKKEDVRTEVATILFPEE